MALWGSDGSLGNLRTGDETYHQAWLPWIIQIGEIIARNEITKGGPVILNQHENELQETSHVATNTLVIYMEQIKKAFLEAGITVPSTHNEKGMRSQSWSTDYQVRTIFKNEQISVIGREISSSSLPFLVGDDTNFREERRRRCKRLRPRFIPWRILMHKHQHWLQPG